jgi:hypothetical protein
MMIESLAEHGVDPSDLVPALMTTHTVKNPEYDPKAKERADAAKAEQLDAVAEEETSDAETEARPPPYLIRSSSASSSTSTATGSSSKAQHRRDISPATTVYRPSNPFGDDEDDDEVFRQSIPTVSTLDHTHTRPSPSRFSSFSSLDVEGEDEGDIGRATSPVKSRLQLDGSRSRSATLATDTQASAQPVAPLHDPEKAQILEAEPADLPGDTEAQLEVAPLPSLPGVSTTLSNTDELVTLDIRWTVVCYPGSRRKLTDTKDSYVTCSWC